MRRLFTFRDEEKGEDLQSVKATTLAEAEKATGLKVSEKISYREEAILKQTKASKPVATKKRKGYDYFIVDVFPGSGDMRGPLSRVVFDKAIEDIPDLTKIRAFTGRELQLSRKTIVH
jgi:hypothetical protein